MANGLITAAQFPGLVPDAGLNLAQTVQTAGALENLKFQKQERERIEGARKLQGKILERLDTNDPRLAQLASASPELFEQTRQQLGLINQQRMEEAAEFAFKLQNTPFDQRLSKIKSRVDSLTAQNRDPSDTIELASLNQEEQDEALKVVQLLPLSSAQRATLTQKVGASKIAQEKLKIQERQQELRELEQAQVKETNKLRREELQLKIKKRRDEIAQAELAKDLSNDQKIEQAANVISKSDRALSDLGFFTTGFVGKILSAVPGTEAFDVDKTIDVIRANLGFAELQKMRDASKTGGALGQVTVREIELLQSTLDSMNVGQSEPQLRESLETIKATYQRIRKNLTKIAAGETEVSEDPLTPEEQSELKQLRERFGNAL